MHCDKGNFRERIIQRTTLPFHCYKKSWRLAESRDVFFPAPLTEWSTNILNMFLTQPKNFRLHRKARQGQIVQVILSVTKKKVFFRFDT